MNHRVRTYTWSSVAFGIVLACSGSNDVPNGGSGGASPDAGVATGGRPEGSGGASTGGNAANGGKSTGGATSEGGPGGPPPTTGPVTGQTDGTLPKAPVLPKLTNVVATMREDGVSIDFDPVGGAADYRVYPMPKDGDVTVDSSAIVVIRGATYRCAGNRQGWDAVSDATKNNPDLALAQGEYTFKVEVPSEPKLGHVYVTSGEGRTPVYAVAGHPAPPEYGWRETRLKIYTTDEKERDALVAEGFRDDGIVFYAPKSGDRTKTVFRSATKNGDQYRQYYFGEADKGAHAGDAEAPRAAFSVLADPADGTEPLMAAEYRAGQVHTELVAGSERFQRATHQGNGPLWHVEWSGITEPTTLVVEALATGCPFQGLLSPTHLDATPKGEFAAHQAFLTLDDLRAGSPTGEVFVNGQHDISANPKAIARSFVQVAPRAHDAKDWDYYQGFPVGSSLGPTTELPTDRNTCWLCGRWKSDLFDIAAYNIDTPDGVRMLTFGPVLGQMYVDFDDWAQGVTGKLRFTALEKAAVDADPDTFLHATIAMDIVSTGRRYPQLIISDRDAPVQEGFAKPEQNSLLIQPIGGPSSHIELQAIHGLVGTGDHAAGWDVNNQAPAHVFVDFDAYDNNDSQRPPLDPAMEFSGVDRLTRFDVYVGSARLYLFLDGKPAGCTRYPSGFHLEGPVTVTYGAVLYHEGADDEMVWARPMPYGFWHRHEATETKRHFDDLAWKKGVPAPAWDEKRLPCTEY